MPFGAGIRPEERGVAASAFFTLFGILASHTLLETARDALFLARLPASRLPWLYLIIAVAAVGITALPLRSLRRVAGRYQLSAVLGGLAFGTLAFWPLAGGDHPWALSALYVWTGVVGTVATLSFWLVIGETLTLTQAKRLYRWIGLGSVLGAIAGAAAARAVSTTVPIAALVPAAGLTLALTALLPALRLRGRVGSRRQATGVSLGRMRQVLADQPYVSRLAGFVLVSSAALTLGDYVFKSAVARYVPAEELGTFFASLYLALNLLAFLAQVWLMEWLLRAFGVHPTLWILPVLVFLGAAGVAFGGGLTAALLLKGADGTLRNSVHRTASELLFLPIPDGLRARVKPVIDVVGQRGGQALASVLILSQVSLYGDTALAAAAAVLCALWVASAAELRPHYVEMFRRALREGVIQRTAEVPELDLASLEALFAALNSQDDVEVVAAMDLLAEEGRGRLIPALVLYHPSKLVVLRALELFEAERRTDFVPIADRLLSSLDPDVRAAALRARSGVGWDEGVLGPALADPSPLVRATAAVSLLSVREDAAARTVVDELMAEGSRSAQSALARSITQRPSPSFTPLLLELAGRASGEALAPIAQALGAVKDAAHIPALVRLLAPHAGRGAARRALVEFGAPALGALDAALGARETPRAVKRQIPFTLTRFPPLEAAAVLLGHLLTERDGMVRFRILRALNRIAVLRPDVALDARILARATEQTLEAAFRLDRWRGALEAGAHEDARRATPGHTLLVTLMHDKKVHAVERVFRLLSLTYRGEDFKSVYNGLHSSSARVRASSRELLENLLPAPLRQNVLALVDDGSSGVRELPPPVLENAVSYEALLATLLSRKGTLGTFAAYHVGELGLTDLRPMVERVNDEPGGTFVARLVDRTLQALNVREGGTAPAR